MKKNTFSSALFLIVFAATYLVVCFAIPGMRIKLAAGALEYFIKSIGHMVLFKSAVSLVAALIAGAIPMFIKKGK